MSHFNYLNNNSFTDTHAMYDNLELDTLLNSQALDGNLTECYFSSKPGLVLDPLEEFGHFAEKLYEKNNMVYNDTHFYENVQKNYILQGNSENRSNQQMSPVFNDDMLYNKEYPNYAQCLQMGTTQNSLKAQIEEFEISSQINHNLEKNFYIETEKDTNIEDENLDNNMGDQRLYHKEYQVKSENMITYNDGKFNNHLVAKSSNICNINYTNPWKLQLKVVDSSVSCLSIGINYNGYSGKILKVYIDHPFLVNNYARAHDEQQQAALALSLYESHDRLASVEAVKKRVKYLRNIDDLNGSVEDIVYKTSAVFGMENPYEPQYYRFEIDLDGNLKNETKCGMCPYCEEVKFLPFKNSSYLSHLTLEHGIFSNNYLTPNGLYYGTYIITKKDKGKNDKVLKSRKVDGIQCPHCFAVIEVGCWSMKANKLLSYFRHFKNVHGDELDVLKYDAVQEPLINIRGRRLKVLN